MADNEKMDQLETMVEEWMEGVKAPPAQGKVSGRKRLAMEGSVVKRPQGV
jgi:hypothetical protein